MLLKYFNNNSCVHVLVIPHHKTQTADTSSNFKKKAAERPEIFLKRINDLLHISVFLLMDTDVFTVLLVPYC